MELKITQEGSTFFLEGIINEFAKFQKLFEFQGPQMILNLKQVSRINSTGVREWINAIETIDRSIEILFIECPPIVVYQMNMIPNFASRVKVKSVFAPHFCPECGNQDEFLIEVENFDKDAGLKEYKCTSCGAVTEFDDDEESYFYFMEIS